MFVVVVVVFVGLVNYPPKLWRVENEVPIQLTKSLKYLFFLVDNPKSLKYTMY